MMRSVLWVGAVGVLTMLFLTACATSNDPAQPRTSPITEELTMTTPPTAAEAEVREVSDAQAEAMITGDITALGELLADGYTLTHITGYEQPKQEWLAEVASGRMNYHSWQEVAWVVEIDGDTARIETRVNLDATIYGSHRVWPLEFETYLAKINGQWLITRTVAATV